ncbi:MAG: hypothetical protein SFW09_16630 [Hyphomicrobiaceae bacterium]|nr:hypothetical protein [Hyphomicrobiaceae bacterium]
MVMTSTSAEPGELLAMPFACSVENGRLSLSRSPERLYAVMGRRDERSITLCGSFNVGASRCRSLPIHRFSMDCGGTRVAWLEVAAIAARGQPWRTTLVDGRLVINAGRNSSTRERHQPVTLPPGFAPLPDVAFRFAQGDAPPLTMADAAGPAIPSDGHNVVDVRPSAPETIVAGPLPPPTPREPSPEAAQLDSVATDDGSSPAPIERGGPSLAGADTPPNIPRLIGQGWTATVSTVEEERRSKVWSGFAPPGGATGLMTALAIAGLLLTASALAMRQRLAGRAAAEAPQDEGARGTTAASPAPPKASPPPPEMPQRSQADRVVPGASKASAAPPPPLAPGDLSGQSNADEAAWAAVVEMRATADALVGLVGQIVADHVPDGPLREVLVADLHAIAARLDGPELAGALSAGRLDLVHPIYAQAIGDLERARTLARIEHERSRALQPAVDEAPATIAEACAFLGVNPRAGEPAAKRVVDALRQSWHPDLAGDEADRTLREARIKQINAAWDLIRGR